MNPVKQWAIAIHAGAGTISRNIDSKPREDGLKAALDAGQNALFENSYCSFWSGSGLKTPSLPFLSALAAVEFLEACPLFNAGCGSALNVDGKCEMEAAVMDGTSMHTGAVCGLSTVKHPSRLASTVYSHAAFQFLGFSAAERYADRFPALIERKSPDWFITKNRKESLENYKTKHTAASERTCRQHGQPETTGETVGAAVCDGLGNVAVVTSTGGTTGKWAGRIGDTPMIGSGSYASNGSCAVSGTGIGEQFIRFAAASRLCCAMEYGGLSFQDALTQVVRNVLPNGAGGFVGVSPSGEVGMDFNSTAMFRGCRNWQGMDFVKIWE